MANLFGTSGIRGVVNADVTPRLAMQVGQAVSTCANARKILVGRDTRTTSPMLQHALATGITSCGATALQQGMIPTPVLAFLTRELKVDCGVMITASHNPPQYNGIKLFNSDTTGYNSTQQKQVENVITRRKFKLAPWQNIGETIVVDETWKYIEMAAESVQLKNPWKIVVDPGNGAMCQIAPELLKRLNCKVIAINSQPDGHFPGRGAEPDEDSLEPLCGLVRELKADLGLAYDGDGDRLVTVDEKGCLTPPDQTFAAYGVHALKKQKGKVLVTHVEASMCVETMVNNEGGEVVRTKVGDVEIGDGIRRHHAAFGGEPCGAWIHPQHHYCPDGLISSILLLQALEETNNSLASFVSKAPQYPLLRYNVSCPNSAKSAVLEKVQKALPAVFGNVEGQSKIDGFRLALKEGWVLVRPSGTEPLMRITVEAETLKAARTAMKKAVKLVGKLVGETSC